MHRIERLKAQSKYPTLIENPIDLFYLTGLELSKGRLLIGSEPILFVDGRYYDIAKNRAPCAVDHWEMQSQGFEKHKKIAFDSAYLSYDEFLYLKKDYPNTEWIPHPHSTRALRMVKEKGEIEALKKAARLTALGIQKVIDGVREHVSEEELALEFEFFVRKEGASGLSFESIIAFGENSAYPHYRAGKAKLKKNQIVLIDVGAVVDHYAGDMTRVFFFGTPDPKLLEFERIVAKAKENAIQRVKPGIKVGELDKEVQAEFEKLNVKPLYIHSLGHGIGLQTHEYPRIKAGSLAGELVLQPGMVFTIEPGLYQPGLGGVRLEDMIVVTETGFENISVIN